MKTCSKCGTDKPPLHEVTVPLVVGDASSGQRVVAVCQPCLTGVKR